MVCLHKIHILEFEPPVSEPDLDVVLTMLTPPPLIDENGMRTLIVGSRFCQLVVITINTPWFIEPGYLLLKRDKNYVGRVADLELGK